MAAVARLHGVERGADGGGVAAAAEGDRPGQGAHGPGADADQQRVVGESTGVRRDGDVPVGLDPGQGVVDEPHVLVGGEALELHAPRRRAVEGLEHGQRAVLEAVLAAQQGDVQVGLAEERAQRQARLEAGDAAAGDDDAGISVSAMAPCSTDGTAKRIGNSRLGGCGFSAASGRSPRPRRWRPTPALRAIERVGQQLVGLLLGDPGRRAQA